MFWRRSAAPEELLKQADRVAELTRVVARYFREPSEPAVVAVKSRGRAAADGARAAMKIRTNDDWLTVSRSLMSLADSASRSVAQAKLLGVGRQQRLSRMALALSEAAFELERALRGIGEPAKAAAHLVEAKRFASNAAVGARQARQASLKDARVVVGLKEQEVFRRLDEAAEAAHAAADRLAEVLSQKT